MFLFSQRVYGVTVWVFMGSDPVPFQVITLYTQKSVQVTTGTRSSSRRTLSSPRIARLSAPFISLPIYNVYINSTPRYKSPVIDGRVVKMTDSMVHEVSPGRQPT